MSSIKCKLHNINYSPGNPAQSIAGCCESLRKRKISHTTYNHLLHSRRFATDNFLWIYKCMGNRPPLISLQKAPQISFLTTELRMFSLSTCPQKLYFDRSLVLAFFIGLLVKTISTLSYFIDYCLRQGLLTAKSNDAHVSYTTPWLELCNRSSNVWNISNPLLQQYIFSTWRRRFGIFQKLFCFRHMKFQTRELHSAT